MAPAMRDVKTSVSTRSDLFIGILLRNALLRSVEPDVSGFSRLGNLCPARRASGEVPSAPFPLRTAKHMRPNFDQARDHLENRNRGPLRSFSRAKSTTIDFVSDPRVRAFLNDEFHQLDQDLPLIRIGFQALSFGRDLQPKGHISRQLVFSGFDLPLP